jgi:hypothetical protein
VHQHRDSRDDEQTFYRIAVGAANLALAAMLIYGVTRYFDVIVPRFGNRFFYVPVIMGGIAVWMLVRGLSVLLGRGRGGK